jgi:hypothetical protein
LTPADNILISFTLQSLIYFRVSHIPHSLTPADTFLISYTLQSLLRYRSSTPQRQNDFLFCSNPLEEHFSGVFHPSRPEFSCGCNPQNISCPASSHTSLSLTLRGLSTGGVCFLGRGNLNMFGNNKM